MNNIIFRTVVGRPLRHLELDNNFKYPYEWDINETKFLTGMLVLYNNTFYKAKQDITTPALNPDTHPLLWDPIGSLSGGSTTTGFMNINLDESPLTVTGNYQLTGLYLAQQPAGWVHIFINGKRYSLGNGTKTKAFYFIDSTETNPSTAPAKAYSYLNAGDKLVFNGTIAGHGLSSATDEISMLYQTGVVYSGGGGGGGGGSELFLSDIAVSLNSPKTLGKYSSGQTIPSLGKTPEEVMNLIAIESIYPTYNPATISIFQTLATYGEVGEVLSNTITGTYTANDAGSLSLIKIQKSGVDITPTGNTSPHVKSDTVTRIFGTITYRAFVNYNAGALKLITPSNTPDDRTALVRNVNAPQASEVGFASSILSIIGLYKIFYGDFASAPTTSANVRAAVSNRLTNAGNTFVLNTNTTNTIFAIWMPNANSLVMVFDVQTSFDITSQFVQTSLSVNDAGGTPVPGKLYTMTNSVPYSISHQFNITIS